MHRWAQNRSRVAGLAVVALATIGLAATAVASIVIYENGFPNKGRAGELSKAEGSHCEKTWRERQETILVEVKRGPEACGYRPPVEGLGGRPDHDLQAKMKILNDTPKGARGQAYLGLEVRSSAEKGYELRVFPRSKTFELRRRPGGGPFPESGALGAINGINQANRLRLRVDGARVRAYANGTLLADVTDPNPSEVGGQKLEVIVGNTKDTSKNVFGIFDDLKVAVPNP
jgi:hypothetical protein